MVVKNIPGCSQLEIIEKQAEVDLQRAYNQNGLFTFYGSYMCRNYTKSRKSCRKIFFISESTHCCEQFFQKMKLKRKESFFILALYYLWNVTS